MNRREWLKLSGLSTLIGMMMKRTGSGDRSTLTSGGPKRTTQPSGIGSRCETFTVGSGEFFSLPATVNGRSVSVTAWFIVG